MSAEVDAMTHRAAEELDLLIDAFGEPLAYAISPFADMLTARQLALWLAEPNDRLGGRRPIGELRLIERATRSEDPEQVVLGNRALATLQAAAEQDAQSAPPSVSAPVS